MELKHFSKHESIFEHFCSTVLLKAKITIGRKNSRLSFTLFWPILIKNYRIVKTQNHQQLIWLCSCPFSAGSSAGTEMSDQRQMGTREGIIAWMQLTLQSSNPAGSALLPAWGNHNSISKSIHAPTGISTCKLMFWSALLFTRANSTGMILHLYFSIIYQTIN